MIFRAIRSPPLDSQQIHPLNINCRSPIFTNFIDEEENINFKKTKIIARGAVK